MYICLRDIPSGMELGPAMALAETGPGDKVRGTSASPPTFAGDAFSPRTDTSLGSRLALGNENSSRTLSSNRLSTYGCQVIGRPALSSSKVLRWYSMERVDPIRPTIGVLSLVCLLYHRGECWHSWAVSRSCEHPMQAITSARPLF